MGTVNVTLGEDTRLNLILGQQLENAVTSVMFDFSAWQTTYGAGTLALSVQRPGDEMPYAVTLTTSGTNATWSVTNLDTAYKGVGHIQLTYTVGSAIKKSVVYKFTVYESLGANGEYPSPGQTWQEEMEQEITDVKSDLTYAGVGNAFDGLLSNAYWNSSGALVSYSGDVCNTNKIPCKEGDIIKIITDPVISDVSLFVPYFDSTGTTRVRGDTGTGTTYEGTAPAGASYVCFTFEKSGLTKDNFNSVKVYVNNPSDILNEKLPILADINDVFSVNLPWYGNGYIKSDGTIQNYAGFSYTDYIYVGGKSHLKGNLYYVPANYYYVGCYNSNYEFLGGLFQGTGQQMTCDDDLTLPDGTVYIRVCDYTSQRDTLELRVYTDDINNRINNYKKVVRQLELNQDSYRNGINISIPIDDPGTKEREVFLLSGHNYVFINNTNAAAKIQVRKTDGTTVVIFGALQAGYQYAWVPSYDCNLVKVYVNGTGTVEVVEADTNCDIVEGIVGDELNVSRCGRFILDNKSVIRGSYNSAGSWTMISTRLRNAQFIKIYKGEMIHFVPSANIMGVVIGYFDTNKVFIRETSWITEEKYIDVTSDGYVIFVFKNYTNTDIVVDDYDATVEVLTVNSADIYNLQNGVEESITKKNIDILPAVNASSYYGHNGNGSANINRQFSLLVTTDVHGDSTRFNSAIEYLNNTPAINAGICLGDILASNYTNPSQWYIDGVNNSSKPFYTVLGNHDGGNSADASISATVNEQFNRLVKPTLEKIGLPSLTVPYYKIENATYKIAIICLDCYDAPDTKNSSGDFVIVRGDPCYSQTQIDWFISALNSIPSDYHLIIAQHYLFDGLTPIECVWSKADAHDITSEHNAYNYKGMIPAIVNAWINGESINQTYVPNNTNLPTLVANADFTNRGQGNFACYIVGHTHWDMICKVTSYPTQHVVNFDTTSNDLWQNYWSDLPREIGTKAEDLITVIVVDKSTNTIRLVRVGSNITDAMTERTMYKFSY